MAEQSVQLNFLSRADGSALYSLGTTVVVASVTGPAASRPNNRLHNKCNLEVLFYPRNGQPMVVERGLEGTIGESVRQIIADHLHPRAAILLNIQELQSEQQHQLFAASINASCLAMMDAGLQLKGLLAAVSCCFTNMGVIVIEPGPFDTQDSSSLLTFVFESSNGDVVGCQQHGSLSSPDYIACLARCKEAAKEVFAFYRIQVEKRYTTSTTSADNSADMEPNPTENYEPV